MKKRAEQIWDSEIEFLNETDEETEELLELMRKSLNKLELSMNHEQQTLFDEYYLFLSEYHEKIEKKAFLKGFEMGAESL